jgi:ABC-type bacteriocin/lantibiotic exporter with double-glycine peptidase domain
VISNLWGLVQKGARVRFVVLLVLVSLGGLVELAGIAATAELMGLVASKGEKTVNGPTSLLANQFQVTNAGDRLRLGLVVTIIVLGFVHSYSVLRTYLRSQFVWIQDKEISSRLFRVCLHRPYTWFLGRNSAELHRLLSSGHITQSLLGGFLAATGQVAVAGTLTIALFVTDPFVAIVGLVVVCAAYGAVRVFTRKALGEKGGNAHRAEHARRLTAQEALTSIRFVKTTAREDFFVDQYTHYSEEASKGMVFHGIYVDTVRSFLEWVTIGAILSLSVYLVLRTEDLAALLPRLTLYTMAGYRVVPAVHELFGLWSRLKFDGAFLSQIQELLDLPEPDTHETGRPVEGLDSSSAPLLALEQVAFRYDGAPKNALTDVSLRLDKGQWIGIVGTTGAGKTTLLDLISGLCVPTAGQIRVGETVLTPEVVRDWQSHLGVVPQEVILLDDSIARNVAFGVDLKDIDLGLVENVCQMAGLGSLLSGLPDGLDTKLGERGTRLSGGERQRVGLARALYRKPLLLLLDEATSALDQATEARIIETLKDLSEDCTLVTVAHRLSSVQPCDQIYVVEAGKVVSQGTFEELLTESEQFKRLALATSLVTSK